MNTLQPLFKCIFQLILLTCFSSINAYSALWVTGYYPGYKQCDDTKKDGTPTSCDPDNDGTRELMPPSAIDFTTVTHVIHFAMLPGINVATGEPILDEMNLNLNETFANQLVAATHAAKRKVLLGIGGSRTADGLTDSHNPNSHLSKQVQGGFRAATATPEKTNSLVNQIVTLMQKRHYDGIDVDWEPICFPVKPTDCEPNDTKQFTYLIKSLREKLNSINPKCKLNSVKAPSCPLLTTAISLEGSSFINTLQNYFDQINIMTYGMGGPWFENNWMTWFNAPLYNHQATVLYDNKYPVSLPSTDSYLKAMMNSEDSPSPIKIPSTKLGVGIPFYGQFWSGGENLSCTINPCQKAANTGGAIQPRQAWTPKKGKPPIYLPAQYDYATLMTASNYERYDPYNFFWDYETESSYISIDAPENNNDRFITYDDEATVGRKVRYAQSHNLGGIMIWELPAGYLPPTATNPKAARQPLLNAIKMALTNTQSPTIVAYNNAFSKWKISGDNTKIQPNFKTNTSPSNKFPIGRQVIFVSSSKMDGELNLTLTPLSSTIHPGQVEKLTFAIYFPPGKQHADSVAVKLSNPWQHWFPRLNLTDSNLKPIVNYVGWYKAAIPIETLNPWGRLFNKLSFINQNQNDINNVFYIDNIEFIGR